MSPSPARSTLMTSAPIHASSCVQVGPDCTCVKSRIFTPSSALLIWCLLSLFTSTARGAAEVNRPAGLGCLLGRLTVRRHFRLEFRELLAQRAVLVEAAGLVADHG